MKRQVILFPLFILLLVAMSFPAIQPISNNWGINANGPGSHGVSIIDFDNDGDKDLYITSFFTDSRSRNFNQLFIHKTKHSFINRAPNYDVDLRQEQTHDAIWVDYDRDGLLDLFVAATLGRHHLFRQVNGQFTDVSNSAGINSRRDTQARGVAAGDVNGDGWPDIFIVNNGSPNQLFINDGQGHFVDEARSRGVADPRALPTPPSSRGIGQGVTMVDFDEDGDLDIFVCVREMNPRLFVNNGKGRFSERAAARGIQIPEGCDGATFGDLNRDGRLDLVTSRSNNLRLRIFYQTPQHHFTNMSDALNLEGRAYTPVIADLNLDGAPDIILAQSNRRLKIYLNDGEGDFEDMGVALMVGNDPRAAVATDLDDDGDFDIVVVHKRDNHRVFQTQGNAHWIKLKLLPPVTQSDLYGVRVKLFDRMRRLQFAAQITSSFGYLAHAPPDELLVGDPDDDFRFVDIDYPGHPMLEYTVFPDHTTLLPLTRPTTTGQPQPNFNIFGCRRGHFLCP